MLTVSLRSSSLFCLLALAACEVVTPTNPFDPATPPDRQEPAALRGHVTLRNADVDAATLARDLSAVRVGLVGDDGRRVERDGDALAVALSADDDGAGGGFFVGDLAPGGYTVVVDNLGVYRAPVLPVLRLTAGADVDVGDLVFTFEPGDTPGPGRIDGEALLDVGGAQREVKLFKRVGDDVLQQASALTDGAFAFDGLNPGHYALVAGAAGYTSAYRLDVDVDPNGAVAFSFVGDDALRLFPISAVLAPQPSPTVRLDEGRFFVGGDDVALAVLAFGGVSEMRLSTNPALVDDAGADLPFVPYNAATTVALPASEGPITIFAQFQATGGGFTFTSDVFQTTVVRDVSAPDIVDASFVGLDRAADGSFFANLTSGGSPGLRVDAQDVVSAVDGVATVVSDVDVAPTDVVFDDVSSAGGLVGLEDAVALGADGDHFVFVVVRDRAGNVSPATRLAVHLDRSAPEVPLLVDGLSAGVLETRAATLRFDVAQSASDLPVAMQIGTAPLSPTAAIVPFEEFPVVEVGAGFVDGQDVAFEARLIDAAGNERLVRSNDVRLSLRSRLAGRVLFEGVPEIAADGSGATVVIKDGNDALVASAVTAADGSYAVSGIAEGRGVFVDVARAGWSAARLRLPALPTQTSADAPFAVDDIALGLARGSLTGVFRRADLAGDDAAHANIAVALTLESDDRTFTVSTVTDATGSYTFRDVPATRDDETVTLQARRDDYAAASARAAVVASALTVVDAAADGRPVPVLLPKNNGAFDICAASGPCVPSEFQNGATVRVRLRDATDVTAVRARARAGFAADDVAPAFVAAQNGEVIVDVAGADGRFSIFVQTQKSDGSTSNVLEASVVKDTLPPVLNAVGHAAAAGAVDARFTRLSFVDVDVDADAGSGAPVSAAPLAAAAVDFVALGAALPATPPATATACAPGALCRLSLPGAQTQTLAEGRQRIAAWACDAAGNCSAPQETFVIRDVTPPSSAHGAGFTLTGGVAVAGKTVLRSPLYGIDVSVGRAIDAANVAVVDEAGVAVADVYAFRASFAESTFDAQLRPFSTTPAAASRRSDVVVPALPAVDGTYRVFAELVDAAGNATVVEPNAFFQDAVLDTTPPAVAFTVAGGRDVVDDGVVSIDVVVPAGGEVPVAVDLAADGGLFGAVVTKTFPLNPAGETFTLPPNGDGNYTVFARFRDAAGNVVERQDSVLLDTAAPDVSLVSCLSCTSAGGRLLSNLNVAALSIVANDASGVVSLDVEVEDANAVGRVNDQVVAFTGSASVTLFANTTNTVRVAVVDRAGNRTATPALLTIVHDDTLPALTRVELADGAARTSSTNVVQRVTASDAGAGLARMRASATLDFSASTPTEFRAVDFVDLAGADGAKQRCVQVEDAAGNKSAGLCDSVDLDRAAPVGTIDVLATTTRATTVQADLVYPSDTTAVAFAPVGLACAGATYVAASGSPQRVTVDLDGGDGVVRVFACFKDGAGNVSANPVSDSVVVDRTAPAISVALDAGAAFTLDENVAVQIAVVPASDAVQSAVAVDTAIDCSTVGYAAFVGAGQNVTLPLTDGVHTVFACVKDAAGNVSARAQSTIFLDRTNPTGSIVIEGGAALTKNVVVGVDLTRAADVVSMAVSSAALNCATATYESFASVRTVTLGGVDGLKTVNACLKDAAGRTVALNDTITLDRQAPLASISINNGAATTSTTSVTVNATFDADAVAMSLSAFPLDCNSATYSTLRAATAVDLVANNGPATVFACFKDAAGNTTASSDSIFVEQAQSGTLVVSVDSGALATLDRDVVVTLIAPADASQMKIADALTLDCNNPAGYIAFATTSTLTLIAGGAAPAEGTRTVSACVKTTSNQTLFSQDTILLDTFVPGGSVVIDAGSATTNSADVTLTITKNANADDVHQIGVSSSSTSACQSFEAFVGAKSFTLGGADGTKDVFVCLKDDAGNTAIVTDTIVLDRAPPSPVAISVADFSTTTSISAALSFPVGDTALVAVAEGTLDCASTQSYVAAAATLTVSLSASEGSKVVVACFKDAAGNTSQASDITTLDLVAPTGSVLVAGGAAATTSRDVTLTLNAAADVDRMAISESATTPNCNVATYVAFVQQPTFTLSTGDGTKTVQVCLQDRAGRKAAAAPDAIRLDQGAPDGAIVINNGDAFATRRDVVLAVSRNAGSEDANEVAVAEGALACNAAGLAYVAFQPTLSFSLSAGEGTKTVSLCLRDAAGNFSATRSDSIVVDTVAPGGSVVINGNAATTTSRTVTLTLNSAPAEATLQKAIANEAIDCQTATFSALGAVPATVSTTLAAGDGSHAVFVCFKDAAGNVSVASDSIVVDATDPLGTIAIVDPEGNADGFANTATVTVALAVVGEDSATTLMAVREAATLDCTSGALSYEAFASTKVLALTSTQGLKRVAVCFKDAAGRVTPTAAVPVASITLDTAAPAGTLNVLEGSIVGGTHFVGSLNVTAVVSADADVNGLALSTGALNCSTATFGPFSAASPVTLPIGDGAKTITACLKDASGLRTQLTKSVTLDTLGPSSATITVQGGATVTNTLALSTSLAFATGATEAHRVAVGEGIDCASAAYVALTATSPDTTHPVTLSAGDGARTVTACFKDDAGNVTTAIDQIVVDQTAPAGLALRIQNGAAKTNQTSNAVAVDVQSGNPAATDVVKIAIADRTGLAALACAGASYVALVGSPVVTFTTTTNETKRVDACFEDAAGNRSVAAVNDSIVFDNVVSAAGITVSLAGTPSSTVTRVQAITATVAGMNAQAVRAVELSELANYADAVPKSVAAGTDSVTLPFQLTAGDANKTVRARVTDDAGNVSADVTAVIRLDTTPPAAGTLTLAAGAALVANPVVAVAVAPANPLELVTLGGDLASGAGTTFAGADQDGAGGLAALPATVTLRNANGQNVVTAFFTDAAGNPGPVFQALITSDTTAPANGTVVVADGATVVNTRTVPVSIQDTTADFMRFFEVASTSACGVPACNGGGFTPFAPQTSFTLSATQGAKKICWRFCDAAGNGSGVASATLNLGTFVARPRPILSSLSPNSYVALSQSSFPLTIVGRGIAGDTEASVGDFTLPCVSGNTTCQADSDGGCAVSGTCASTCATSCTVDLPDEIMKNSGTYAVRLHTPAPVTAETSTTTKFFTVVAPLPQLTRIFPRGVHQTFDSGGVAVPELLTFEVEGRQLMDNAQFRLGDNFGSVLPPGIITDPSGLQFATVVVSSEGVFDNSNGFFPTVDGLVVENFGTGGGSDARDFGLDPTVATWTNESWLQNGTPPSAVILPTSIPRGRNAVVTRFGMPTARVTPTALGWVGLNDAVDLRDGTGALMARYVATGGAVVPLPLGASTVDLEDIGGRAVAAGLRDLPVTRFYGGTGTLTATSSASLGVSTQGAALADVDADGTLDFVIATTAGVRVQRAGGVTATFAMGSGVIDVAVADLDADGKLDIASADFSSSAVSVRLGNGSGGFGTRSAATTSQQPRTVDLADLNNDGAPDLIAGADVRLGNGDGSFGTSLPLPGGNGGTKVALGDIDGDGALDVAVSDVFSPAPVLIARGLGDGSFSTPVAVAMDSPQIGDTVGNVVLADINGDGALDLLAGTGFGFQSGSTTAQGGVSLRLGNGDGTFGARSQVPTGAGRVRAIALVDLNGDRRLDLIATPEEAGGSSTRLVTASGNGNGTFNGVVTVATTQSQFPALLVGDLDNDGAPELASIGSTGLQTFSSGAGAPLRNAQALSGGGSDVLFVDANRDFVADVLGANSGGISLALGAVATPGTFGAPTNFSDGGTSHHDTGDFNGDGLIDVVTAVNGTSAFGLFTNNGAGGFNAVTHPETGASAFSFNVLAADADSDGKSDLFNGTILGAGSQVFFRRGNGNGTFAPRIDVSFSTFANPNYLSASDFNNDGKLDLAASDGIRLGNGDGTFQAPLSAASGAGGPVVADVNSDGKMDLIGASGGSVVVLLGNGNGTFGAPLFSQLGKGALMVRVGQIDGDGLIDVVMADSNSDETIVGLGDGVGNFHVGASFHGGGTIAASIADVTGDGTGDLGTTEVSSARSVTRVLDVPGTWQVDLAEPAVAGVVVPRNDGGFVTVATTRSVVETLAISALLEFESPPVGTVSLFLVAPDGRQITLANISSFTAFPNASAPESFRLDRTFHVGETVGDLASLIGTQPAGQWQLSIGNGTDVDVAVVDFGVHARVHYNELPPGTSAARPEKIPLAAGTRGRIIAGTTIGFPDTGAHCNAPAGGRDHFYEFTIPAANTLTFVGVDAPYDAVVEVRNGTCAASTNIACDDDGWFGRKPRASNVVLPTAGTYCVVVDGFAGVGDYDLHLRFNNPI